MASQQEVPCHLTAIIMLGQARQVCRFLYMMLVVISTVALLIMIGMAWHISALSDQIRDLKYTQEGLVGTIERLQRDR